MEFRIDMACKYEDAISVEMACNYSSLQFDELSLNWEMRMYVTRHGTETPMDSSEESVISRPPTRDEMFDNIIKKHAEAWRQLSEM